MALGSNNPFPSVLIVETTAAPTSPSTGRQRVYIDATSHRFNRKTSTGGTVDMEFMQAFSTADPATPVNGTLWFFDDGGTPSNLSVRVRKAGVTYEIPLGTLTT